MYVPSILDVTIIDPVLEVENAWSPQKKGKKKKKRGQNLFDRFTISTNMKGFPPAPNFFLPFILFFFQREDKSIDARGLYVNNREASMSNQLAKWLVSDLME